MLRTVLELLSCFSSLCAQAFELGGYFGKKKLNKGSLREAGGVEGFMWEFMLSGKLIENVGELTAVIHQLILSLGFSIE